MDKYERVAQEMLYKSRGISNEYGYRTPSPNEAMAIDDLAAILRREYGAVEQEAFADAIDIMCRASECYPLRMNYAEDARDTWPDRWSAAMSDLRARAKKEEE